MLIVRWEKKFETGNALIGAEHKILVMLFNKLDIALKKTFLMIHCLE
jgi:hemerythrin